MNYMSKLPRKKTNIIRKKTPVIYLLLISICTLMLLTIINIISLYLPFDVNVSASGNTKTIQKPTSDIDTANKWKLFLQKHPTYLYGWLELAQFTKDQGNTDEAALYVERARALDPNNETVLKLRKELARQY